MIDRNTDTAGTASPRGFRRIRTRLVFWTILVSALFQLPLALFDFFETRRVVLDAVRAQGRSLATLGRARIDARKDAVEHSANTFAALLNDRESSAGPASLLRKLRSFVRSNDDIFGSTIALSNERFAPYFYRGDDGELVQQDLDSADYDYRTKDWFKLPIASLESTWSEPYFDEGGGDVLMTTFSVPFFYEGELKGVVTADLSLAHLEQIASAVENTEAGYCSIVARSGKFLYHPDGAHLEGSTIGQLARTHDNAALAQVSRELAAGKSGFVQTKHGLVTGRPGVLVYDSDPESGWSLIVFLDQQDLLAGLTRLTWIRAIVGLIGLLLLITIVAITAHRITRPLRKLSASANEIARGNLDRPIPEIESGDEIGALGQSFSRMRRDLRQHVADLTAATAAKQKLESELEVAHQIQLAMVPGNGNAEEEQPNFQLAAKLIPARAVGGDWYDYFLSGEDQLEIVIGDVSDKGVPAAMLMSKTVSSIRAAARSSQAPAAILSQANAEFSKNNDTCMFATIFYGILNLSTGELEWASAGHNPPVLLKAGGEAQFLKPRTSLPIGLSASSCYETSTLRLEPGDTLVLYTDGVTEAFDPAQRLFGDERLMETVGSSIPAVPIVINQDILTAVSDFANGADQSDDITLLTLRFGNFKMSNRQTFTSTTAATAGLKRVRLDLVDFLGGHLSDSHMIDNAATITAEVLDNLREHTPTDGAFAVHAEICDGGLVLKFVDEGPAFDPLKMPPSGIEKEIGGHGLQIVRALATNLSYERSARGENILTAQISPGDNDGC